MKQLSLGSSEKLPAIILTSNGTKTAQNDSSVYRLYNGQLRLHGLKTEELLQVYIFANRTEHSGFEESYYDRTREERDG
jgi:hypothetical protein